MKTSVKLLGFAVASAAVLTACNGNSLPGSTGTPAPDQPGFTGRITKNNMAVSGRKVFLKQWTGATAGQFGGNSSNQTGINATTDSNGNYFLPLTAEQASSGGIFSAIGHWLGKQTRPLIQYGLSRKYAGVENGLHVINQDWVSMPWEPHAKRALDLIFIGVKLRRRGLT